MTLFNKFLYYSDASQFLRWLLPDTKALQAQEIYIYKGYSDFDSEATYEFDFKKQQ